MPNLTGSIADLGIADLDARGVTKARLESNASATGFFDTAGQLHLDTVVVDVVNGQLAITDIPPTDSIDGLAYQLQIDYIAFDPRGVRQRRTWSSGWFELNADATLVEVADVAVPNAPAITSAAAAAAEATAAAATATTAAQQAIDISNIDTSDDAVSTLVADPTLGPKTTAALTNTIASQIPAPGPVNDALNGAIGAVTQIVTPLGGGADDAAQINAALATNRRVQLIGDFSIGSAIRVGDNNVLDASSATITALANCGYLLETAAMANILLAPRTFTATSATTGGTLAAGTYYYRVSATLSDGSTTLASLQVSATTTGSTSAVALSWQTPRIGDVTRIVSYQIWRGTSPGIADTLVKNLTAVSPAFDQTVTFTDSGATPDGAGTFPVIGTTFARTANVTVLGGTWNCRSDINVGAGEGWQASRYIGHGFNLQKIDGLTLRDIAVQNAYKWAIAIADATDLVTENITFSTGSDGIHVLGPINGWRGRAISGHTGDDLVGMSLVEWPNQTASEGDILNVTIDGIHGIDAPSAVRMLLGTNRRFDNIKIRDVDGEYTYYRDATTGAYTVAAVGVVFLNADNSNPGRRGGSWGRVEFSGIQPTAHFSDVLQVDGTGDEVVVDGIVNMQSARMGLRLGPATFDSARPTTIQKVTINDAVARHANAARAIYVGQANTTVNDLIINRPGQWQASAAVTTNPVEINAATVQRVKITDATVIHGARPSGNNVYLLWCSGSAVVTDILVRGAVLTAIQGGIYLDSGTFSKVAITSSRVANVQGVIKSKVPVAVVYSDLDADTIDAVGGVVALFTSGASPVTVSGSGLRRIQGTEAGLYKDGSQTVTARSITTEADASKLTKGANAMAYNTNASLSCGVGPIVCDGTNWKHLFTGATY